MTTPLVLAAQPVRPAGVFPHFSLFSQEPDPKLPRPMRIAHLILAHRAPAQLARLLAALAHPQADCFLHLDRQTDLGPFAALYAKPQVRFVRRRQVVNWGGYGLTEALLAGLRDILAHPARYEFVNLLSGQDYPLQPAEQVHAFLSLHRGQSFVQAEAMGTPWWALNRSRLERYHLTDSRLPGRYVLQRLLNAALPRRRFPVPGYTVYGGNMSCWYTLSRAAAEYLLAFFDAHPELARFGRLSWGSDEFLVTTVLYNSPLRATLRNDNLRHIDWTGGGAHPKLLTRADLPALLGGGKLWARKFDLDHDAAVLDALDQLHRPAPLPLPAAHSR